MKFYLALFLIGCLLILVSYSTSAQDTTRRVISATKADSTPFLHAAEAQNKTLPQPVKDTVPVVSADTPVQAHAPSEMDSASHLKRDTAGSASIPVTRGNGTGRRNGSGRQSPAVGHFYGRIIDAKTGKGLDGTSVQLIMSVFDDSQTYSAVIPLFVEQLPHPMVISVSRTCLFWEFSIKTDSYRL